MRYPRARVRRIVEIATAAAKAHAAGSETYRAQEYAECNGVQQVLDLAEGGMCNRFVRQCYEVALGIPEYTWLYQAGRAKWTIERLEAAKKGVDAGADDPQPGDIIGIHTGTYGHVAIYVGDGMVAENTSCDTRGTPRYKGTKLTPYSALKERVTGIYRLAEPGISVVWKSSAPKLPDSLVTDDARLIDGRVWAPVREMGVGLGFRVDASRLATEDRIILSEG